MLNNGGFSVPVLNLDYVLEESKIDLSDNSFLFNSIFSITGEFTGKILSTAIPLDIFLIVNVSEDPLLSIVKGTGMVLENLKKYEAVLL